MATFYLRTRTAKASSKRGGRACDYIAGEDRYSYKDEVMDVYDLHLPDFAPDARALFVAADKNERSNGRSYRSVIFAIPNEAPDPLAFALALAEKIAPGQAGRLAIHQPKLSAADIAMGKEPNTHAHFIFTERTNKKDIGPEDYFSRANGKVKCYSAGKAGKNEWLKEAKAIYLDLIRLLVPDYAPPMRGEKKIGPKLKGAKSSYEEKRQQHEADVTVLRADEKEVSEISAQIKTEMEKRREKPTPPTGGVDSLLKSFRDVRASPSASRPSPSPAPALVPSPRQLAAAELRRARAQDLSIGKDPGTSRFDRQEQNANARTAAKIKAEVERIQREAEADLKWQQQNTMPEQDTAPNRPTGPKHK